MKYLYLELLMTLTRVLITLLTRSSDPPSREVP